MNRFEKQVEYENRGFLLIDFYYFISVIDSQIIFNGNKQNTTKKMRKITSGSLLDQILSFSNKKLLE